MTKEQRKIIEDKAEEKLPYDDTWNDLTIDYNRIIFIKGAEAMDEILQKEIAVLKEEIKDNERTIIRLTNI